MVVSVSNDETAEEAGRFAKEIKATFPVVHDPRGQVYDKLGVAVAPTNILIDRSGKVAYVREGEDIKGLTAAVGKAVGK